MRLELGALYNCAAEGYWPRTMEASHGGLDDGVQAEKIAGGALPTV